MVHDADVFPTEEKKRRGRRLNYECEQLVITHINLRKTARYFSWVCPQLPVSVTVWKDNEQQPVLTCKSNLDHVHTDLVKSFSLASIHSKLTFSYPPKILSQICFLELVNLQMLASWIVGNMVGSCVAKRETFFQPQSLFVITHFTCQNSQSHSTGVVIILYFCFLCHQTVNCYSLG